MDGKHLLSGSRDGMIGLWDVESGTLLNAEAHKERQELERKRLAKMEIKAREKDPKARYKYALQLGNLSIYEAFLWFSLAEDAGSKSAAASLEALIETGEISTECVVLAYFQLGKWYETGTIIEADSAKSMEYFTQCALKAGLPGFTTVDELAKKLGLPDNLDFSQPLRSA